MVSKFRLTITESFIKYDKKMSLNRYHRQKLIPNDLDGQASRHRISYVIIYGGLIFLTLLCIMTLIILYENGEGVKLIFNVIVPLIATWVGTVLAFYFGRENFEAATKQIVNALNPDIIDDIPIENIMIDTPTIVYKELIQGEEKNHKLIELSSFFANVRKDRAPIFSKDQKPLLIIHKSTIDDYLIKMKNEGKNELECTLETILNDPEYKGMFGFNNKKGFVVVSKNEMLEKVIEKMKTVEQCKDIFVTENGRTDEKVLGWVTDSLIARFLNLKN